MSMSPRLLRPRATGFDPRSISGLELYLNAKTGITRNGDNVSAWADGSGKGRNATQDTGANQPAFVADGWLGRPCVQFTRGSSHFLQFTPFAITAQTVFFVIEPTEALASNVGNDLFYNTLSGAGSLNRYSFLAASGYRTYAAAMSGTPGVSTVSVGANIFAQSRMVLSHRWNGTGNITAANHAIRKDRAAVTPGTSGLYGGSANAGRIAARFDSGNTDSFLSARFAMILIYSRDLSASEIEAIENWAVSEYPL